MSSDYIISFTDSANGSFVIKPSSTNGPLSPIATTPLDPQATSANTSLVLLGMGMYQYGQRFQKSVVHMLEHFAYKSRPAYAIQGQVWYKNQTFADPNYPSDPTAQGLYVFDGTDWSQILVAGAISGDLDIGGFKIVNLGAPTVPSDAANAQYVNTARDSRVAIAGDTMTGFLTLSGNPTSALHAATKQYVDTSVAAGVVSFNTRTGVVTLLSSDVTTALTYTPVNKAGDTMTGFLTLNAAPTLNLHAATKQYVDAAIAGSGGVTSFNSRTGAVLLNSTDVTNALGYVPVNVAGDTMLGVLTLSADPVNNLEAATKQYVDTTVATSVTNKVSRTGDSMSGFLTLSADPTSSLHAATKNYVDATVFNAITGLDFKDSVRLATTANITTLDNTAPALIDGVAWLDGDRILVKDQTTAADNGIYVASTSGAWVRSSDANGANGAVNCGMYTFIEEGTANAHTGWVLSTPNPITLGVTSLTFVQFTGGGLAYVPVNKAGDTMTGFLTLNANPTSALHAATKQYVDTADNLHVLKAGDTMTGNLSFSGNGLRLLGNFNDNTLTNRLLIQTSTINQNTDLGIIPNGSGTTTSITSYNNSDPTNAGTTFIRTGTGESQLVAGITGTGSYLPLAFYTGGSERIIIDTTGATYFQCPVVEKSPTAVNPAAGVLTLDCSTGTVLKVTLNGNVTSVSLPNVPSAVSNSAFSVTIMMSQDAVGGRTVSWSGPTIKWSGGTAPVMTSTANKTDIITLLTVDAGSTWFGNFSQNF